MSKIVVRGVRDESSETDGQREEGLSDGRIPNL